MRGSRIFVMNILLTALYAGILVETRKAPQCKCRKSEFACEAPSGGKCACIPITWKCDGEQDCEDGVDESDCVQPTCPPDWFLCKNGKCVKNDWKCDGENDCGDDSDEEHCPQPSCDESEKTCGSGECIPIRWWCDEDEDCSDGSDEAQCESEDCSQDEFQCNDGRCIPLSYKCDGDFDCGDGLEEEECDTEYEDHIPEGNVTCKEEEFSCNGDGNDSNGAGGKQIEECIPIDYVCDGEPDCDNRRDELNCIRPCTNAQFRCADGQCINLLDHCDGIENCGDGSDETLCPDHEACMDGEFRCGDGVCLSRNWRCDGDSDCKDGSDENGCVSSGGNCGDEMFECHADKRCILDNWRCDGSKDCNDGSDELFCDCEGGQYLCLSGECIAAGRLCNGIPDCLDSSDERPIHSCNNSLIFAGNFSSCSDRNGGCEHTCREEKNGRVQCICRRGFQLASDMRSCVDIDECKIDGSCSQSCNNTHGSFVCSCLSGYTLRPDRRTCKASGPPPALLFSNRIDIRWMEPDRSELRPILQNLENAIGLDYHIEKGLMFWSDVTLDRIMRSHVNGSGIQEVVSSGLESPGGVAVDWIHDLLFWTDSWTSRIEVSHLDGSSRKVLIWEKLEKPRALALHPLKGLMFWTDWGSIPCLESAAMDGTMRQPIASRHVHWPNGLTIDYTNDQIYWSDAKYHIIETARLDGGGRRAVISRGLPHPFGITIFEDKLYWTDWDTKSVNSANKFTGNGVRMIRSRLHFPMDIRTFHPLRQPKGVSKCQENQCSHLCLPKPSGFTCVCPTGFQLVNVTHCSEDIETFLVFTRKNDIRRISFDANERTDSVIPVQNLENAVALDWLYGHPGYIYWSDIGTDTISRAEWDGKHQESLITTSLDSPAGIAIDWITNKIYWTDSGLNRIEVALLDGSMRCVLVWTGLDRPRAIIVNPKTGHMFWSDWGTESKIERAGMDGSNRTSIVTTGLQLPNGMTFDHTTQRIYWVDAGIKVIESCNIHGGERRVIVNEGLLHPFGITVDQTKLYWTDWKSQSISFADKYTGNNRGTMIEDRLPYLMDIRYYHNDRPRSSNPCSIRNGDCSHLCLLAPVPNPSTSTSNSSAPYSCACPTGLTLNDDGRNCNTEMNKFLVIARRSDIRVISLDVQYSADVRLNINTFMSNVVDVAVDPVDGHLYWSDVGSKTISRTSLSSPGPVEPVIEFGLDVVDGLTVDVTGRLLYWTDDGRNIISVSTLDGKSRRLLISENLDSPRALALHYELGYMYWTDWGNNPTAKIERAGMDGSDRSVVISSGLIWPNGITIDLEHGWLIWGDAQSEKIERSDLLGNNRETLRSLVPHVYSLTNMDGFIYWVDWQTRNVERFNLKNSSAGQKTIRENMPSMMGMKAVNMNVTGKNRCGSNNGGCSHLCLRSPQADIGYVCACPTGVLIQEDGRTCSNRPSVYLLFTNRLSIRRVSLEGDKGTYVELPIGNLENSIALDFHYRKQRLYFTDVYLDVIKSANLDGSDVTTIVSEDLKTMDGLAVDWVANNLYWTDAGLNRITVAKLDGTNRKVIVERGLDKPRALCIHPAKGSLFWTDWGGKARIEKSYLDGTGRKVLIKKNLQWPNGLTLDYDNSRIFWVDAHHFYNRIESCDFNGRKRKVIVTPVSHGFAITFLSNTIYWTDWQSKAIHSLTFSSGKRKRKTVLGGIDDLMGIKAVSSSLQTGTNLCDSTTGYGGCTHLCLMRGTREYVCACPDPVDVRNEPLDQEQNFSLPRSSVISGCSHYLVSPLRRTITPTSQRPSVTTPPDLPSTSSSSVLSPVVKKANTDKPYVLHLVAAFLVAAFVVFSIVSITGVILCRHLKRKRLRSNVPRNENAVSFRNRIYLTNSSSPLLVGNSAVSTPQQTPALSMQTVVEQGAENTEGKSLLERQSSTETEVSRNLITEDVAKRYSHSSAEDTSNDTPNTLDSLLLQSQNSSTPLTPEEEKRALSTLSLPSDRIHSNGVSESIYPENTAVECGQIICNGEDVCMTQSDVSIDADDAEICTLSSKDQLTISGNACLKSKQHYFNGADDAAAESMLSLTPVVT